MVGGLFPRRQSECLLALVFLAQPHKAEVAARRANPVSQPHGAPPRGYVGIEAAFGGRPRLPHGLHGVYISRFASVGRDCCIYQNVTIGEIGRAAPRIGDRCLIGAGAILVGGITIGSDVKVGAGAVVHTDVPDGSTVVPGAARILKKERGA